MDRLPIFLNLTDKACLVVGGGIVAERKTRLLLRTGARITVLAPACTSELRHLAAAGKLELCEEVYSAPRMAGNWLVVAATDDRQLNRQIAAAADDAGIWCNAVDDISASSFILPAIVDRSPVIVAIGTDGNAPVLAQQLKRNLEAWLPSRIGELAKQAGRWRDLVGKRFPTTVGRRRFWQTFFDGPIARHLLAGRQEAAEQAMRRHLVGDVVSNANERGEGWLVGAGPGDPGLVTLRGQQLISQADVVLYDRLVAPEILDFARKEADLISVGKRAGSAVMSQEQINELLVKLVQQGKRVCRLKGGDPFIFGRGGEEALALADAGLPFQIVPGISAALGCAAYAGIPLTLRHVSASVTLATARLDDDAAPDWHALLNAGHTVAFYMGVGAVSEIRGQLIANDVAGDLSVAIVANGTQPSQRTVLTTVDNMQRDLASAGIEPPAMVFVGEAVAMASRLQWFQAAPGEIAPNQGVSRAAISAST